MFENLTEKLSNISRRLKGIHRITEKELDEMLREIKLALLEADVNYKVVKEFISNIREKALGEKVMKSLSPGEQVVKIVKDELIQILGGDTNTSINFSTKPPSIIMLVGLQGSGKTTLSAKLANYLRKNKKKPLLVACDVYRKAAITQLKTLAMSLGVDIYYDESETDVLKIAKDSLKIANSKLCDTVIIDTAGRLQIDEILMNELIRLKAELNISETILVLDSMTGQEAVNVASMFNEKIGIDSIILTKLDSDTRGGAALSVKSVTKKPIKFASIGEKLSDLEAFYPDRIASRILGMGDILSAIEKAEEMFSEDEAIKLEKKIRQNNFTLDDYLSQISKIKKMGMKSLMNMLPNMPKELKGAEIDEKGITKIEAIIKSMTIKEKEDPDILNASRRKRIASGSGTKVEDINRFINQYEQTKKIMKDLKTGKNPLSSLGIKKKGFR